MIEYGVIAVTGAALAFGVGIVLLSLMVHVYGDDIDWDLEKS